MKKAIEVILGVVASIIIILLAVFGAVFDFAGIILSSFPHLRKVSICFIGISAKMMALMYMVAFKGGCDAVSIDRTFREGMRSGVEKHGPNPLAIEICDRLADEAALQFIKMYCNC